MNRLFPEHRIRHCQSLDGLWEFEPESACAGLPVHSQILVPSCWEMLPGWESWRGRARLSRKLVLPTGENRGIRLLFGGVSHTAEVFWDGELLARHEDAYTPFECIHWPPACPTAKLSVLVDNTFGPHSALHLSNDYYTYGGITRPVVLQSLPPVYIARLHATPNRTAEGWSLDVRVSVRSHGDNHPEQNLVLLLDGRVVWCQPLDSLDGKATEVRTSLAFQNVEAWSPEHPRLYELTAQLRSPDGQATDDLIDRIGFREVHVEGTSILLNGQQLHLKGFNRHEDHAIFGSAVPLQAAAHDVLLLKELGANFVRTSHYPNDQRFLDLCDEAGLLVWEESHARQIDFTHPRALDQSLASTREMLAWHHNHPSIIIWGCLNECDTVSDEGVAFHRTILELIKSTDPSRPATYAGHRFEKDRCMGLADIVSHNIYTGWYQGSPDDIGSVFESFLAWLDSPASLGGAGKPLIVSEFGAGAIPGFRSPPLVKNTEDYQALVLHRAIQTYGNHARVAGFCIWHFADCRVSEEGNWWMHRPLSLNDKGVLTRERVRKLAFATVKETLPTLRTTAKPDK